MFKSKNENGRAIVLVAVLLLGLIAISSLVIDGGNAYLGRRKAQAAADAGALAGAIEHCLYGHDPSAVITEYVETHNKASLLGWDIVDGEIVVSVERNQKTFFAKVLGKDSTVVTADASAGCFSIGYAGGLLPIAWTCRPPIPGEDLLGGDSCAIKGIPRDVFEDIIASGFDFSTELLDEGDGVNASTYHDDADDGIMNEPRMIYLIADSIKVDGITDPTVNTSLLEDVCEELNPGIGTVDCDFEPEDGIIDIDGGAGRGWLLMNGDDNQGASILFKIVNGEIEVATKTPRWFAGLSGGKASAFGEIRDVRVGDFALIPIFDAVCDTDDPINDSTNCPVYYGTGEDVVYANGTADYLYYRVNGFAVFYISCVSKVSSDQCPGKNRAYAHDVITANTSTVEGYFIEHYNPEHVAIGESSLDLGVYIVSLTE